MNRLGTPAADPTGSDQGLVGPRCGADENTGHLSCVALTRADMKKLATTGLGELRDPVLAVAAV